MIEYTPPKELQPPKDISNHFSITAKLRQPNPIKEFYKYFQIPGIANLAGGLPNNNYFPFDTLEAVAALPDRFEPTPNIPVDPPSDLRTEKSGNEAAASRVVVPKVSTNENILRKIDLKTALQYGTAQGYPPLYAWIRQFTRENLHPNVPYEGGPEVCLTVGNTDGWAKTIEQLMNVWREGKDSVEEKQGLLVEEYVFAPPSVAVKPWGVNIVTVKVDEEGMAAGGKGGLEDVLENWDYNKGQRPHVIYTVTMGQNPTGGVLSVERRKAIYAICVKYDVLIVEDDPYWYLQYPSATKSSQSQPPTNYNAPKSSGYPFLDSLVPSYLSVDYEGRVIRLDTFSKTIAPGCRLGWITAQPALIEKVLLYIQTCTQQPSGFVQSMIAQLVMGPDGSLPPSRALSFGSQPKQTGWKVAGWVRWLEGLRGNYERRMNTMCSIFSEGAHLVKSGRRPSLEGHLINLKLDNATPSSDPSAFVNEDSPDNFDWSVITTTPLYTFEWPKGGMFIWLRMNFSSHPLASKHPLYLSSSSAQGHRATRIPSSKPSNPLSPSNHIYSHPHTQRKLLTHPTLSRALWVFLTQKPNLVLLSPGTMFCASPKIAEETGWAYFRICFAAVDEEEVEGIARRFVKAVHNFWGVKDVEKVERWAEGAPGLMAACSGVEGFF